MNEQGGNGNLSRNSGLSEYKEQNANRKRSAILITEVEAQTINTGHSS